jgi:uncharacterized protein
MIGNAIRAWRWPTLLQLLFATALPGAQAQPTAADAGAQGPGSPSANGSYFGSPLVPPKPEGSCPPNIGPMYQADAIVTGTDMRQRPWGFAQTLREVLVKSSGDPRLKDDPHTAQFAVHADRFVACFDYVDMMAAVPLHDDQGTSDRPHKLTVYFIPAKIDALLAQLGDKPWRGERPIVVPVLLVHGRKPPPYVLSAEIPAGEEQRGSFATAADQFGMDVRVPSDGELLAWGASVGHFPSEPPRASNGEAIVVGTLDWNETLPGWIGKWRMRWQGADYGWGISGVNYDAAFRNIVRAVVLAASGAGSPDQGN